MAELSPLEEAERLGTRLLDAIHEARTTLRDLKTTVTEARTVQKELAGQVKNLVDVELSEEVRLGLEKYMDSIAGAIETAEAAVYKRFDTVAAILLGEDAKSQRQGKSPLIDLAIQKRKLTDGS